MQLTHWTNNWRHSSFTAFSSDLIPVFYWGFTWTWTSSCHLSFLTAGIVAAVRQLSLSDTPSLPTSNFAVMPATQPSNCQRAMPYCRMQFKQLGSHAQSPTISHKSLDFFNHLIVPRPPLQSDEVVRCTTWEARALFHRGSQTSRETGKYKKDNVHIRVKYRTRPTLLGMLLPGMSTNGRPIFPHFHKAKRY